MEMQCRFPFPENIDSKPFVPKGEFGHEKFPECRYAVDFLMDIDTSVLVVKDGTVVQAKHDSSVCYRPSKIVFADNEEKKYLADIYTNRVGIRHKNGVFTEYCHLSQKAVVAAGQKVKAGDVIGYVGKSGIMSEPHLHFNAFVQENNAVKSIPVKFIQ
ncbi:MAG: M23 family metallopeptidase [Candidatus Aenigmarchaeota archaeon]|nr:M23 family metallopeptidase [Candidatus Aenigmarchaeota archaeon]